MHPELLVALAAFLFYGAVHASTCDLDRAQTDARIAYLTAEKEQVTHSMDVMRALQQLVEMHPGSGPTGSHLNDQEKRHFQSLANEWTAYKLHVLVAAGRQRDIDVIARMASLAAARHLNGEYDHDLTKAPDAFLQGILIGLENRDTVEAPVPSTLSDACSLDNALVNTANKAIAASAQGPHGLDYDLAAYMAAMEWLRRLNAASLTITAYDTSDVVPAAAATDVTKVFRASFEKAVTDKKVSREVARLAAIIRSVNDIDPPPEVQRLSQLPAFSQ